MAQFDTVTQIISDVGTELGLGTLTASYASTDKSVLLLQNLLKVTGRRLVLENPWLQNVVSYTFSTTATTTFDLPADFQSMLDGTGWNRTTRQPLVSVSPQQWEALKASSTTSSLIVLFRPQYKSTTGVAQLEFLNTATASQTIALEYRSRYWAATSASTAVTLDAPTAVTDVVRIDSYLFTRALRWAWLRAKGFDSTAAQQDFEAALEATRSANVHIAPVLTLGRRMLNGERLLDEHNVPETGFGS